MTHSPRVSIILPVYNVAKWLPETIRSIEAQAMSDWEAIFVVDGSPDNSEIVIRQAQAKDARIKLIVQENRGQGAARDAGVLEATGEYLFFLDPDDLMPPDALAQAYSDAVRTNADVVIGDFVMFWDDEGVNSVPAPAGLEFQRVFKDMPDTFKRADFRNDHIFYHSLYFMVVWMKLFKATTWRAHNVKAPVGLTMGEDFMTVKRMCFVAERIAVTNHVLVYYRKRRDSATTKKSRKAFDIFKSYQFTGAMYKDLQLSKREHTLMHAAYIDWFYAHMMHFTPKVLWMDFYRCMCACVRSFDDSALDYSLIDLRTARAIRILRMGGLYSFPLYIVNMARVDRFINVIGLYAVRLLARTLSPPLRGRIGAWLTAISERTRSQALCRICTKVSRHLGSET